jgi:hypothetical protein
MISAVLWRFFCGLSIGFHQAWLFLFIYLKRVCTIVHEPLYPRHFVFLFLVLLTLSGWTLSVCVCFTGRALHSQLPYYCDSCWDWSATTLVKISSCVSLLNDMRIHCALHVYAFNCYSSMLWCSNMQAVYSVRAGWKIRTCRCRMWKK